MSHLSKGKASSRDPPPTLSHHVSPSPSYTSLLAPLSRTSSAAGAPPPPQPHPASIPSSSSRQDAKGKSPADSSGPHPLNLTIPTPSGAGGGAMPPLPALPRRESTRATDRTDALWAEMQATLEAVELSAGGAGRGGNAAARVFGPDHERKLDELRAAQIALAQAWARSEADEAIETTAAAAAAAAAAAVAAAAAGGGGEVGVGGGAVSEGRSVATDAGGSGGGAGGRSTVGTGSAAAAAAAVGVRPGSSGVGMGGGGQQERMGAKTEEETEVDILLARKRREANDRYFQRVNQGVLDVVAKLEDVAVAMRAVEQESKELWGDQNESVPGSAKT